MCSQTQHEIQFLGVFAHCVCQVEQEQKRQEAEKAKINEEERKAKRHEKEMIRQVRHPHRLMYSPDVT